MYNWIQQQTCSRKQFLWTQKFKNSKLEKLESVKIIKKNKQFELFHWFPSSFSWESLPWKLFQLKSSPQSSHLQFLSSKTLRVSDQYLLILRFVFIFQDTSTNFQSFKGKKIFNSTGNS
jgi:hypothetical protein